MDNHIYNKLDNILQAEYKRGYEEGYVARKEADQGDNADHYRQGLNDAWELAKQIYFLPSDGGFSAKELENIFGTENWNKILKSFTAQEAIKKVQEYKENQIKNYHICSKCSYYEDGERGSAFCRCDGELINNKKICYKESCFVW